MMAFDRNAQERARRSFSRIASKVLPKGERSIRAMHAHARRKNQQHHVVIDSSIAQDIELVKPKSIGRALPAGQPVVAAR